MVSPNYLLQDCLDRQVLYHHKGLVIDVCKDSHDHLQEINFGVCSEYTPSVPL
jgi:hypothetical protein